MLWKSVELRIAKFLGTHRNPINGRGDIADVEHEKISIEVKHRKTLPTWLHEAYNQAAKVAKDRIPVVILHEKQQRIEDCYCVIRLNDLREMLK
jgi:hypothetical protein